MTSSDIFILTTEGPVAIQRIVAEDEGLHSVICLDGRAEALPVSKAYHAFVQQPIGVIERFTGHGSYRMDVEGRIDEGQSWQLAALIAHVSDCTGETPTKTVFASGEVDNALNVRPVTKVPEKLGTVERFLSAREIDPTDAVIIIPADDTETPLSVAGVPVCKVKAVEEALSLVGLKMPSTSAPVSDSASDKVDKEKSAGFFRVGIVASIIAIALFWFGADISRWAALSKQGRLLELEQALAESDESAIGAIRVALYRQWLSLRLPPEDVVTFNGVVRTVGRDQDCASVDHARAPIFQDTSNSPKVCALEMSAFARDTGLSIVGRMAYWPEGLGSTDKPARVMRGSAGISERTWKIEFRTAPNPGTIVRLVAVIGDAEVRGAQPWYAALLSAPVDSSGFENAARRLLRLGYRVNATSWTYR